MVETDHKILELMMDLKEKLGHSLESYILRAGRSKDLIAAKSS